MATWPAFNAVYGTVTVRGIGRALGVSHSTVLAYLRRALAAGLGWPLPEGMTVAKLTALLYGQPEGPRTTPPLPDWPEVAHKMHKKESSSEPSDLEKPPDP